MLSARKETYINITMHCTAQSCIINAHKTVRQSSSSVYSDNMLENGAEVEEIRITVRLPTDATLYFMYLFPFLLSLPYKFWALISPSSGVIQAVFLYTVIWFLC
jgi:hypothetical protein